MPPRAATSQRKMAKSVFARITAVALTALATSFFLWHLHTALDIQYDYFDGLWPREVSIGGTFVNTGLFWDSELRRSPLSEKHIIARFFLHRADHIIMLYQLAFWAIIGWAGSVCYRIVRAEDEGDVSLSSWGYVTASFGLAVLAGIILSLLILAGAHLADGEHPRVPMWLVYTGTAGAVGAGLFLTLFFKWFETVVKNLWGAIPKPWG